MGSRFPMGMPPMPNGHGAPITVSAPLNDFQFFGLMAAILMASEPAVDLADAEARSVQAHRAVRRMLDLMGHVGFHVANGEFNAAISRGAEAGHAAHLAAIEAEQSKGPAEPEKKIITDGG